MKLLIGLTTVVLCAMIAGCGYDADTKTFTISGKRIVVGSGTTLGDVDAAENSTTGQLAEEQKTPDQKKIAVVITRTVTDDDGTSNNITIASSSFADDKVVLEGEIEERTKILITVDRGSEELLTLHAVVDPDANTSFALLDYESPDREDLLLVAGDSRIIEDSDAKFSIRGDVSSIVDQDLSIAVAQVRIISNNPKDGSAVSTSDPVLLDNGSFLIEGVASEPLLVSVSVRKLDYEYWGLVYAVVEPGERLKISPSKSSSSFAFGRASELMANSEIEGSMHSKVIETWQNSTEYLEKIDEYASAIAFEAQNTLSDSETAEEQTETDDSEEESIKAPYDVYKEMDAIKNSVLTRIAQNLDEPITALIAMELGVRVRMEISRQLESWDKIATALDKDVVARRVLPQRESREKQIRALTNEKTIVEGEFAPEFTLANLAGEDVALYDVLADNEVVLVDFWASWCGPCIAKLPKLKELHTAYNDKGFEIVFVSIDETYDDWKEGSEKYEVPGVNVGDLHGFLAKTPVDYGVRGIPTEFLVDPAGEILDKWLTTDELSDLLVDHFGGSKNQEKVDESASDDDIL